MSKSPIETKIFGKTLRKEQYKTIKKWYDEGRISEETHLSIIEENLENLVLSVINNKRQRIKELYEIKRLGDYSQLYYFKSIGSYDGYIAQVGEDVEELQFNHKIWQLYHFLIVAYPSLPIVHEAMNVFCADDYYFDTVKELLEHGRFEISHNGIILRATTNIRKLIVAHMTQEQKNLCMMEVGIDYYFNCRKRAELIEVLFEAGADGTCISRKCGNNIFERGDLEIDKISIKYGVDMPEKRLINKIMFEFFYWGCRRPRGRKIWEVNKFYYVFSTPTDEMGFSTEKERDSYSNHPTIKCDQHIVDFLRSERIPYEIYETTRSEFEKIEIVEELTNYDGNCCLVYDEAYDGSNDDSNDDSTDGESDMSIKYLSFEFDFPEMTKKDDIDMLDLGDINYICWYEHKHGGDIDIMLEKLKLLRQWNKSKWIALMDQMVWHNTT